MAYTNWSNHFLIDILRHNIMSPSLFQEEPDVSSIMNLKYLDCVINETLRILPCAPG